jgi:hypothetical protein
VNGDVAAYEVSWCGAEEAAARLLPLVSVPERRAWIRVLQAVIWSAILVYREQTETPRDLVFSQN